MKLNQNGEARMHESYTCNRAGEIDERLRYELGRCVMYEDVPGRLPSVDDLAEAAVRARRAGKCHWRTLPDLSGMSQTTKAGPGVRIKVNG